MDVAVEAAEVLATLVLDPKSLVGVRIEGLNLILITNIVLWSVLI
jgi:hypothetical protein